MNLTDAQWHLAILAVLVVLATPATGLWRLFDVAAVILSGLTGPFVLSLIVIAAIVFIYRRQRWTLALGVLAAVIGAVQSIELLTAQRPHAGPLGITANRFIEMLGGRLIGNTVLGTSTTTSNWFLAHMVVYSALLLVGTLLGIGFAIWKGPFELKLFNLWAGLVLAGSLVSPLASIHGSQWQALIGGHGRPLLAFSLAGIPRGHDLARRSDSNGEAGCGDCGCRGPGGGRRIRHTRRISDIRRLRRRVGRLRSAKFGELPSGNSFTFKIRPAGWTMTLTRK